MGGVGWLTSHKSSDFFGTGRRGQIWWQGKGGASLNNVENPFNTWSQYLSQWSPRCCHPVICECTEWIRTDLTILCDPFGMVKWPFQGLSALQLGNQKVTESPGRWWFHVLYIVCARKLGNRSTLTCAYFSNGLKSPASFAKEKVSGLHNEKTTENECRVAKMNIENSYKMNMKKLKISPWKKNNLAYISVFFSKLHCWYFWKLELSKRQIMKLENNRSTISSWCLERS